MRVVTTLLLSIISLVILATPIYAKSTTATAIFAGGCFWCLESDMDKVPGVKETISGYTGGTLKDPTYKQVSNGGTGHYESVKVIYDPSQVTYEKLLDVFWHSIDPTDATGQFCDKGDQYRAVIFYLNKSQKRLADASKAQLLKSGKFTNIATQILPASTFYPAEDYHQNYYKKNPIRYEYYRYRCGRDKRVEEVWSKS